MSKAHGLRSFEGLDLEPIPAPVLNVGHGRGRMFYAFDDAKYLQGTIEIIAQGRSASRVLKEARKTGKAFRIYQHNPRF